MSRHSPVVLAVVLSACSGIAIEGPPAENEGKPTGQAGAPSMNIGSGHHEGGDEGGDESEVPNERGGAAASQPLAAAGATWTSEGGAGTEGGAGGVGAPNSPLEAGAGGAEANAGPQPWEPRVPPQVVPIEGDAALSGVWYGAVELSAPGWWGPPVDHVTVAIDDSGARSFAFQSFGRDAFVIGDKITAPALENGRQLPIESRTVSDSAFGLSYTARAPAEGVQYTEALTGVLRDGSLAIEYFVRGSLDEVSSIDAKASGVLHRVGSERRASAELSGIWYGLASLTAPGFVGPPVDQLTVAFDSEGRPKHVNFEVFSFLPLDFGEGEHEFPRTGSRWVHPQDTARSFDGAARISQFTASSFQIELDIKNHDASDASTDVTVSIAGELSDLGLDVSYSLVGTLDNTSVDAHARGLLLP